MRTHLLLLSATLATGCFAASDVGNAAAPAPARTDVTIPALPLDSRERQRSASGADFSDLTGEYFGQSPPGATPQVFALGIVSTDDNEHSAPSFSPDGNEVFWFANRPPGPGNEKWLSFSLAARRENGRWSAPAAAPFGGMVTLSSDGRRAYFDAQSELWMAEKRDGHWGEPHCLGIKARFPELKALYMPSVTRNGTLYFIAHAPGLRGDLGIYRAELIDGEYGRPELLPRCINLPPFLNWAPFIAPDETFLLFSSGRDGSLDKSGDIYVSRRLPDGTWTDPVSLGEPVNTPRQEVFPGLSPDGRYLFFARDTPNRQNDIYWVETAGIAALHSMSKPTPKSVE